MSDEQVFSTKFTAEVGDVLQKLTSMIKGVLELASTSTALASAMGLSDSALKSFTESLKKAETVAAQFDSALGRIGVNSKDMGSSLKGTKDGIAGVASETEKGTKRSEEYKAALAALKSDYGNNAVAMKGLKNELNKLDNAYQQAILKGDEHSSSVKASYTQTNLAGEALNNYTAKANLAIPTLKNLSEGNKLLSTGLSDTEFKTTSLGKAFLTTSSKSKEFFDALVIGGQKFGANTDKTNEYVKALVSVDRHLQSIPQSSVNAKAAQSELADSMLLSQRATELMSGSITKVRDGFETTSSKVKASGTVMGEYGQTVVSLNTVHKNLAEGFKTYTETHKNNTSAVQKAQDRLQQYMGVVDQVKAKYKDTNKSILEAGDGFRIYGDKVSDAGKVAKQMQYDQGLLTQTFYDSSQVQKVLTGQQELSVQALEKVAVASNANRKGIQELAKDYTGLTKGIQDISQYGKVYADSLKATTASNFTETASVEQAIAAHMKYAKTAEGLIAQSQVMTDTTVKKIKSSEDYAKNLDAGNAAIQTARSNHESLANSLRSTQAIEVGLSREGGTLRDSMLNVANSMGVSVTQTDALKSSASQLLPIQEKYRGVIEGLNNQIKSGGIANEDAKRQLDAHIQSVKAGEAAVQNAKKAQDDHNKSLKETPTLFSNIIGTVERFAMFQVASTIIGGFVGMIQGTISTVMNFDQTLHSLKAITGATSIEMSGMGDTIKEVSASSRYGVEEIGLGLQIMGQAGLSASESMQTIKAATLLATGTLEKMGNVVDLLTSTMSAYKLGTGEAARVTDIMATAANRSKLDIDKLRTSLNYVGVIAAQSGLSLEQTTASLMVLADRGMKASTMGTGLRQVLDKLIAPNEKLREAYKAHGIELDKISPLSVGYEAALQNLTKTLYDSKTGMVDTSKAFELFGIRGAQAATILIQSFASGEWKDTVNSFDEVGSAAKMAEEQMKGLSALWENLVAKIKVIAVSLGEGGLTAVMKGVIQVFASFADAIIGITEIDFGFFGYMASTVLAITATLGVASVAMGIYAAASTIAATTGTLLNLVVTGTAKAFSALTIAMATNPFGLMAVLIAGAVVSIKIFLSYLDSVVESQNKLGMAATEMANSVTTFQQVIDKAAESPEKLKNAVSRLKSEQPQLAEEIKKVTNVLDISTLSYKELTDAMSMVKEIKLDEAIEANIQALNTLATRGEAAEYWMSVLNSTWGLLTDMADTFNRNILWVTDSFAALMSLMPGFGAVAASVSAKTEAQAKNLAEAYVNAGRDIKKSIEEQKAESNKKLESDLSNGKLTKGMYDLLVKNVDDSYKKIELRLAASKINYEKYVNDVGAFYKSLSIKQREEVQNMVYEEEKAVEKFEKFAADKNLTADEKDSELYAIHLKYRMKILDALNEFTKKEYETVAEKYDREQSLLDEKFKAVSDELEKERKAYDESVNGETTRSRKSIEAAATHLNNIATLNQNNEELIRKQHNLTFEHVKKLMADTIGLVKANNSIQLSLLDGFEVEKARLSSKEAEIELALKQKQLAMEKEYIDTKIANGKASDADIKASNERQQALIVEEMGLRSKVLDKNIAEAKIWVSKSNQFQDERLAHIVSLSTQEMDTVKQSYDLQLEYAKAGLEERLSLIDIEETNDFKSNARKLEAKLQYRNESVKAAEKYTEDLIAIDNKEYQESIKAINDKFLVQETVSGQIKNLYAEEASYSSVSQNENIAIARQGSIKRMDIASQETAAVIAEYDKQTEAILNQTTRRGNTVAKDLAERGTALVKETELTKAELEVRKISYVQFGEEIFRIIDQQTIDSIAAEKTKTETFKKEMDNRIISLKTLSDKTVEELDAQGKEWVRSEGKVYEVVTGTYAKIKSGLGNLTEAQKKEFLVIEQKTLEHISKLISRYQALFDAKKRQYSEDFAAYNQALKNIETASNEKLKIDDKYKEIIRKNRQSEMTDERKFYDDLKAINDLFYQAKTTGDKQYNDEALSLIQSLPKEVLDADGVVLKSSQDMMFTKDKLYRDSYSLAKGLNDRMKKENEDAAEKYKVKLEEDKKALDELGKKIDEFKAMKVEIETTSFLTATDTIHKELNKVIEKLKSVKGEAPIDVDISPFMSAIDKAKENLLSLMNMVKGTGKEQLAESAAGSSVGTDFTAETKFTADIGNGEVDFLKGATEASMYIDEFAVSKESTFTINVDGMTALREASDYVDSLQAKLDSLMSSGSASASETPSESVAEGSRIGGFIAARIGGFIQRLKKGGVFSGKLPGFGGGDIVNAQLEPGEFVLRKEAVSKIGVNALREWNNLNSTALKSINPTGGSGQSNSMFSGQLHTINLNIGNSIHTVYGESNVLNQLTSSLRRSRLMTAS